MVVETIRYEASDVEPLHQRGSKETMKRGTMFAVLFGAVALSAVACGDDDDDGDDANTGGTGGGGQNVECTPGGGGACQNEDDCPAVMDGTARSAAQMCGFDCQQNDDPATCTVTCIVDTAETSAACSTCYAALVGCASEKCLVECQTPASDACTECQIEEGCRTDFDTCSGLDTVP
jgi:hypothetical protein